VIGCALLALAPWGGWLYLNNGDRQDG